MSDPSDYDTKEKLNLIIEAVRDDDADEEMTDWEINFIISQETKQKEYDVDFSESEEYQIDKIFEKLWKKDLI
jgi:hypothetical protein